jgi:PhzF family phenazine biosynthesis protein
MGIPLLQIDAFARQPFEGNPAGVCLLEAPADAAWMQALAAEMNLSETAFLVPGERADAFGLRWFTPAVEVALCGHATLASAHALWSVGRAAADQPLHFETLSGVLTARPAGDGAISIDLPARPVTPEALPPVVERALTLTPRWTGAARKGPGGLDAIVECESEAAVREARPDVAALRDHRGGLILTARGSTPGWDVVSRYFAPAYGVDEDPVTGSAHCALATYWAPILGRDRFVARQVSRRGGTLEVRLDADRVHLTGHAVTVFRAELT